MSGKLLHSKLSREINFCGFINLDFLISVNKPTQTLQYLIVIVLTIGAQVIHSRLQDMSGNGNVPVFSQ